MKNALKLTVSSLLAVLALSSVASSAGAANPTFKTPGHSGATISGAQNGKHILTFGSLRELECESATFSGTLSGESSTTLTLVPIYKKCKTKPILGISFPATVTMNGCDYLLHTEENASREAFGEFAANVDLICPLGEEVVVDVEGAAKCFLTVEPFAGHRGIIARNVGTFIQTVRVTTNISFTSSGSGGICGGNGQTSAYEGETNLEAFSAGVFVPLEAVKGP